MAHFFFSDDWADVENQAQQALAGFLRQIQSPMPFQDLWPDFCAHQVYRDLRRHWSHWTVDQRQRRWEDLCREMERAAYATRPYCLRCGECCRRGSPTLVAEDLPLLHRAVIRRFDLLTLRAGEVGWDNALQEPVLLQQERIKIKEKPGTRECLFFESVAGQCSIYPDRPFQCRQLECWNPDRFREIETRTFLFRKDLLPPDDPWRSLVEWHEGHCGLPRLQQALSRLQRGRARAQEEILDLLAKDEHLRSLLEERQGVGRDHQLFLFGRPLIQLINSWGLKVVEDQTGRLRLVAAPCPSGRAPAL